MGKTTKSTMYSRYDSMMRIAREGARGEDFALIAGVDRGVAISACVRAASSSLKLAT
jgi:hypothetical protein